MTGSVCVNERCGYRQKGEHRNCPRCGWLMLDGPLPETGSIAPPPRVLNMKAIGASAGAGVVLFLGAIGMIAGSFASADPVAHANAAATSSHTTTVASHEPAAAVAPVAAPAVEAVAPAPVATPAAVAAAAPASVAKKTTTVAKAPAKKPVAKKKAPAKKTTAKKTVARR